MFELKPCPFCGQPPAAFPAHDGPGLLIECMTQGCVRPQIACYGEGVAAARWNERLGGTPRQTRDDADYPSDTIILAAYSQYRSARKENLSGRSAMRNALREAKRMQSITPFGEERRARGVGQGDAASLAAPRLKLSLRSATGILPHALSGLARP